MIGTTGWWVMGWTLVLGLTGFTFAAAYYDHAGAGLFPMYCLGRITEIMLREME